MWTLKRSPCLQGTVSGQDPVLRSARVENPVSRAAPSPPLSPISLTLQVHLLQHFSVSCQWCVQHVEVVLAAKDSDMGQCPY